MAKKVIMSLLALSLTRGFFIFPVAQADGPLVLLSEICTDPQSDWSTNNFDGTAGDGSITSSDEYIEIVNVSGQAVDLTGWTIRIEDSAVDIDEIDGSLVKNEEIEGEISQMPVGAYYVLGNPVGSMNNDVRVELFDDQDSLIDGVSLGNWDDGNQEDNAPDGNAQAAEDEVVARNYDNQDTDLDVEDFQQNQQSMGQVNPVWPEEEEEEVNEEPVEDPQDNQLEGNLPHADYSEQVFISEVLPNPEGSDTANEFIELYNASDQEVDLAGWQLGDATSRLYTIESGDLESTVLAKKSYLAIYRPASGISLNNSGDQVVLYNPNQEVVDQLEYQQSYEGQSWAKISGDWQWTASLTPGEANVYQIQNEAPEADIQINQTDWKVNQLIKLSAVNSVDADGDELTFFWKMGNGQELAGEEIEYHYQNEGEYQITLTVQDIWQETGQAQVTVTITDYDYSEQILINELLPNPEENDKANEWIELINLGDSQIDLAGWQLTDQRTEFIFPEDSVILPQDYLLIWRDQSKIGLNNSGDKLLLIDPRGKVINGVEYQSAKSGLAFARVNQRDWRWTDLPTPERANVFSEEEEISDQDAEESEEDEIKTVSLQEVADLESRDLVTVRGTVAVEPGILGKNVYYLQDKSGGAQIYCSGDCPKISRDDLIQLSGKISVSQGHNRIKAKKEEVKIIGQQAVEPLTIKLTELDNHLNSLVQISGQVVSVENSRIYLEDHQGENAIVYLKQSTGLKKSLFEEGQELSVTGIVEPNKEEIRLLPRGEEDLQFAGQVLGEQTDELAANEVKEIKLEQDEPENNNTVYVIILILLAAGGAGYYFWHRKNPSRE